jgi:hypothetical protein
VPELSAERFQIRTVKPFTSLETLKMIYNAYIHSVMNYGIILGEIPHVVILVLSYKTGLSEF